MLFSLSLKEVLRSFTKAWRFVLVYRGTKGVLEALRVPTKKIEKEKKMVEKMIEEVLNEQTSC